MLLVVTPAATRSDQHGRQHKDEGAPPHGRRSARRGAEKLIGPLNVIASCSTLPVMLTPGNFSSAFAASSLALLGGKLSMIFDITSLVIRRCLSVMGLPFVLP